MFINQCFFYYRRVNFICNRIKCHTSYTYLMLSQLYKPLYSCIYEISWWCTSCHLCYENNSFFFSFSKYYVVMLNMFMPAILPFPLGIPGLLSAWRSTGLSADDCLFSEVPQIGWQWVKTTFPAALSSRGPCGTVCFTAALNVNFLTTAVALLLSCWVIVIGLLSWLLLSIFIMNNVHSALRSVLLWV